MTVLLLMMTGWRHAHGLACLCQRQNLQFLPTMADQLAISQGCMSLPHPHPHIYFYLLLHPYLHIHLHLHELANIQCCIFLPHPPATSMGTKANWVKNKLDRVAPLVVDSPQWNFTTWQSPPYWEESPELWKQSCSSKIILELEWPQHVLKRMFSVIVC